MDAIAKVGYSHDKMIDLIVSNPRISQNELANHFGYTPGWVSQVVNSDAFRERLAQRREDVVDPVLRMSLEERIRGVVDKSLQVLLEKLEATGNPNIAIRVLEHGSRALGYGARPTQVNVGVTSYVAVVPAKSLDSAAWSEAHGPAGRNATMQIVQGSEEISEPSLLPRANGTGALRELSQAAMDNLPASIPVDEPDDDYDGEE